MLHQAASQITPFSVAKDSNSSNVIPMLIEEFKPSKLTQKQLNVLHNHFRDSYDCSAVKRGRPDQTVWVYDLLAPIAVAVEESADESAIRERAIELLFSKRDLQKDEHKASFEWICENENLVCSFGRSILDTALQSMPDVVMSWFNEDKEFFTKDHTSRIRDNLAVMYAGICLVGKLCASLGVSFAAAFPFDNEECAKYLDTSVRQYLLDDSTYNKGVIESTFEVMARMKLNLVMCTTVIQNTSRTLQSKGNRWIITNFANSYARRIIMSAVITKSAWQRKASACGHFTSRSCPLTAMCPALYAKRKNKVAVDAPASSPSPTDYNIGFDFVSARFFLRGTDVCAPHALPRCTFCATSVPLGCLSDGTQNFQRPCGVAAYMYLSTYIYREIYYKGISNSGSFFMGNTNFINAMGLFPNRRFKRYIYFPLPGVG